MSDTAKLESEKSDYIRDLIAWLILIFTVITLFILKPPSDVRVTSMYLPDKTHLSAIEKDKVKVLPSDHTNSHFLYQKVGFITVMIPYSSSNEKEAPYEAIEQARILAAKAGADKLLIDQIYTMPWFDTGATLLRIQARALK